MSCKSDTIGNLIKIIGMALIATAVYQELRKHPNERKWHGRIAGFIPYELRIPTIERLRERLWNPDDPRIFTEHVFGVGWAVNFHSLRRKLESYGHGEVSEESEDVV